MKLKIFLVFILAIIFLSKNSIANVDSILSPEEYLEQVKNQSPSYLAANQNAEAFELLKKKAKLVTAISLFANTQNGFTEQNQALQIFRYNEVYTRSMQVGLSQLSSYGLNTKLSYSLVHVTYKGLNTANLPNPGLASSNYQITPKIELSLPLWQNRFGSATRALEDATYFSNESQKLLAKSVSIQSLVAAEKTYWALVYANRALEIQRAAIRSAEQILSYVNKKEKMNLGEKADVLQARALHESRKLALKQAENNYKIAARNFNRQRYLDSDQVEEKLKNFDFIKLQNLLTPTIKTEDRFDVKAEEAKMKNAIATAKIDEENNKPSLNLFGSYSNNQIQQVAGSAVSNSFVQVGRAGVVGVNFSTPINFSTIKDIQAGARESALAAKTNYRQKIIDQENDWENLLQNLATYKENLKLAQAIEEAQKLKLENERLRLKQGRTNTYQVLLFEQDYSNSQLTTIEIANTLLGLVADQKLYGNNL